MTFSVYGNLYRATIQFADKADEHSGLPGPPLAVIEWAERYGVVLAVTTTGWQCTGYPGNVVRVVVER